MQEHLITTSGSALNTAQHSQVSQIGISPNESVSANVAVDAGDDAEIVWNREREAEDYQLVEGPSFQRTLTTLLWKDYQQFCKSRKKSFCCRMSCPIICILLMAYFGLGFGTWPNDEIIYNLHLFYDTTGYGPYFDANPPSTDIRFMLEDLTCVWDESDLPPGYIAIAPNPHECSSSENGFTDKQCQHLESIINILNMSYTYWFDQNIEYYEFNTTNGTEKKHYFNYDRSVWGYGECAQYFNNLTFDEGWLIAYFNGNTDINKYIGSNNYGRGYNNLNGSINKRRPIVTALVFDDISEDGIKWEYTIRVNGSGITDTSKIVNKFDRDAYDLYSDGNENYIQHSWINIQEWIDQSISYFIANITNNTNNPFATQFNFSIDINNDMYDDKGGFYDRFKGLNFYMPTAAYSENDYWSNMQYAFLFFLMLMYIYPINLNVSALVEEKAAKIAEGMKMMGATKSAYWLSFVIWFGMEQTFIAFCIAFIGHWLAVFNYSNPWIIFLWIWGFSLSLSGFSTLVSTCMYAFSTASICVYVNKSENSGKFWKFLTKVLFFDFCFCFCFVFVCVLIL